MANYAINEEGVEALRKLAYDLRQVQEDMEARSGALWVAVQGMEGLGIYGDTILEMLSYNTRIVKQAEEAVMVLSAGAERLAEKIEAYIQRGLLGGGGGESVLGGAVKKLQYDRQKTTDMWIAAQQSVEAQIENYREALLKRGVPAGEWMDNTLKQHKDRMLAQEREELEVASGHKAEAEQIYPYPSGNWSEFYDRLAAEYQSALFYDGLWKRIREEHSTGQDLRAANPKYGTEKKAWTENCQRCVPAYEMRRRGYQVQAKPRQPMADYLARHPFDVWENPEVFSCQGNGRDEIMAHMSRWGDGARAQVIVIWDRVASGHTFIAEQRGDSTCFYDPQSGEEEVGYYFEHVQQGSVKIARVDHLRPSEYIEKCCEEAEV